MTYRKLSASDLTDQSGPEIIYIPPAHAAFTTDMQGAFSEEVKIFLGMRGVNDVVRVLVEKMAGYYADDAYVSYIYCQLTFWDEGEEEVKIHGSPYVYVIHPTSSTFKIIGRHEKYTLTYH